jgi:glycosyltransferase involved in cell wall biosynthesis
VEVSCHLNEEKISLSIIIPAYNVEKFIKLSLNSIYNQKTSYLFEVIVIDDGSTDETLSVVKEFQEKFSNFKVYRTINLGAGAARNLGMKVAVGKYIYFFDSDDLLESNFIEKAITILENEHLDVLMFSGKSFLDEGLKGSSFFPVYSRINIDKTTGTELITEYIKKRGGYSVQPCLYISRLDFLRVSKITFPEGIVFEDNYFTSLVFIKANKIKSIDDIFFNRRIRSGSVMTSTSFKKKLESANHIINYFYKLSQEINDSKKYFLFIWDGFVLLIDQMKLDNKNLFSDQDFKMYKQVKRKYILVNGKFNFMIIKLKILKHTIQNWYRKIKKISIKKNY